MEPRIVEDIERSRLARLAFDVFSTYLSAKKQDLVKRLVQLQHKTGVQAQDYTALTGGISVIEEIESELKRTILKSDQLEKELIEHGNNPNKSK